LAKVEINIKKTVIVIDGDLLEACFNSIGCRTLLLRIVLRAPCVLICRCSPTQKAMVVSTIKNETKTICLSIGDGGNDVAMIQEADVGVGIFGKEGKQAALSSDFSINEFKHLKKLLFWHGRMSYKRTCSLAQFIVHRGLLITVVQMCFSLCFFGIPISVFDG